MADVTLRAPDGAPQTLYLDGQYISTDSGGVITVGAENVETLLRAGYTFAEPHSIAANQAASTAGDVATLVTDFNALLDKLQAAGIMAADS